jgi:hypothetical protein
MLHAKLLRYKVIIICIDEGIRDYDRQKWSDLRMMLTPSTR